MYNEFYCNEKKKEKKGRRHVVLRTTHICEGNSSASSVSVRMEIVHLALSTVVVLSRCFSRRSDTRRATCKYIHDICNVLRYKGYVVVLV